MAREGVRGSNTTASAAKACAPRTEAVSHVRPAHSAGSQPACAVTFRKFTCISEYLAFPTACRNSTQRSQCVFTAKVSQQMLIVLLE